MQFKQLVMHTKMLMRWWLDFVLWFGFAFFFKSLHSPYYMKSHMALH